ncbi:MAG: GAF domain-containing protein [bacterium]
MAKEDIIKKYKLGILEQLIDFLLWAIILVFIGVVLWSYKEGDLFAQPLTLFLLILILGYNVVIRTERTKNFRRRERLSYLTQVSLSLAKSSDLEEIRRVSAEAVLLLVKNSSACVIEQVDEEGLLSPKFYLGLSEPPTNEFGKEVLKKGGFFEKKGQPYKIGLPLISGNDIFGTLEVYLKKGRVKPEEKEALTILSSYTAQALINAASYEETVLALKKERAGLLAVSKVDRSISEERLNLSEQLNLILKESFRAVSSAKSEIWIAEDDEFSCLTTYPLVDMVYGAKTKMGESFIGLCAESQRPINCPNLSTESKFVDHLKRNLVTGLYLPLIYHKKIVGVMALFNKKGDQPFSDDDIQVLDGLSTQAAIAIYQAKTHARLRSTASSLVALYEISRSLAEGKVLDDVLQLILKKGCELFSCENGSIMLLEEKTGELTIKSAIGLSEEIIRSTKKYIGDGSIAGWVAKERKPLILHGKVADEKFSSVKERVKDALCVPMIAKSRLVGVFSLSNRKGTGLFAQRDMELLSTLANEAGLAIETAILYDLAQRRIKELLGIKRIASEMIITRDPKEVIGSCLDIGREVFDAEYGWFFIRKGSKYSFHSIRGRRRMDERDFAHIMFGDKTVEAAGEKREPLVIDNCEQDPRFTVIKGMSISTILAVPVLKGDDVMGVIQFLNKLPYFTKDDIRTAQVLADQMAIAMGNAELFEETKRRALELSTLNQLVSIIVSTTEISELLPKVVALSSKVMRSKKCWFHFVEDRELILSAEIGLNDMEKKRESSLSLHKGIAGICAGEKKGLLISNLMEDTRLSNEDKQMYKPVSYLSCPIMSKNDVIGVISCSDKISGGYIEEDFSLFSTLTSQVAIAIQNAYLYSDLEKQAKETFTTLSEIVSLRHLHFRDYIDKVSSLSFALAKKAGLGIEEQERVRDAAKLCDIGKIGIADELLKKPASELSEDELAKVKKHPLVSCQILRTQTSLKPILPIVYHHHESYDGTGYIDGLSGENIPIGSRIIAIVDFYCNIFAKGQTEQKAKELLRDRAGSQFDPELVSVFINKVLQEVNNG